MNFFCCFFVLVLANIDFIITNMLMPNATGTNIQVNELKHQISRWINKNINRFVGINIRKFGCTWAYFRALIFLFCFCLLTSIWKIGEEHSRTDAIFSAHFFCYPPKRFICLYHDFSKGASALFKWSALFIHLFATQTKRLDYYFFFGWSRRWNFYFYFHWRSLFH